MRLLYLVPENPSGILITWFTWIRMIHCPKTYAKGFIINTWFPEDIVPDEATLEGHLGLLFLLPIICLLSGPNMLLHYQIFFLTGFHLLDGTMKTDTPWWYGGITFNIVTGQKQTWSCSGCWHLNRFLSHWVPPYPNGILLTKWLYWPGRHGPGLAFPIRSFSRHCQ